MPNLRLTWLKSSIGYKSDQKRTIKALGFHHLHQTIEQEDTPAIRGMVAKVRHLIRVEREDRETA
jgi:large subunit ribosomal protein L30